MLRYTVSWYDEETGVTITKPVELDQSLLEDIAMEAIPRGYLHDILRDLRADIDIQEGF